MRLMYLLFDWPALEHYVRHECGFIVPTVQQAKACPNCDTSGELETYEDVWVWT
jgi:rubrerythrin